MPELKLPSRLRRFFRTGLTSLLLVVGAAAAFYFAHDHKNSPLCHQQALTISLHWLDRTPSGELPNVDGQSDASLAKLIREDFKQDGTEDESYVTDWTTKYRYVPGLRRGDPGDLVLLYMNKPTRWRHHAAGPPFIFNAARWMIVPLDFAGNPFVSSFVPREIPYEGEASERVSLEEFKSRLKKTLEFLRKNDRPHWQTVVAENEEFLRSIESE